MRILVQSNSPWVATGYGKLAKYLLPMWQKMGHEVACFGFNGLYGGQLNLNGITMLPLGNEMWGRDKMEAYNKLFQADIYMTFLDVWAIPEISDMNLRWVPYCPVDHEPCQDAIIHALRGAYRIVSMTENGQKLLKEKGRDSTPIYHGVDPELFKPGNRAELKKLMGYKETDFVVGIVAMNKGVRKNYADMFETFAEFRKRHNNAKLYLHTDVTRPDGLDLIKMANFFGIADAIMLSDKTKYDLGYPEEDMAKLYQMFDALLMTTAGEGFGWPIVEAQACGTPVITNDFTTGKELNAIKEFAIPPAKKYMDNLIAWQALTDVPKAVAALEEIYKNDAESYTETLVEFSKQFHWDVIAKQWKNVFDEIEKDLNLTKQSEKSEKGK